MVYIYLGHEDSRNFNIHAIMDVKSSKPTACNALAILVGTYAKT